MASSSSSTSAGSSSSAVTPPHYFPTPALDHAFAGIVAGAVATICMNPLDLIKVQFQVNTTPSTSSSSSLPSSSTSSQANWKSIARRVSGGNVVRDMSRALRDIVRRDGYAGLYRGISPNVVGNSASWGFYFLWYTMIKEYMASPSAEDVANGTASKNGKGKKLSASQHLLAASESGAITALITNPIWVVKTRMFTTSRSGRSIIDPVPVTGKGVAPAAATHSGAVTSKADTYTGLIQGVRHIWKHEGWRGLYKGAGLALVGVSNGAIQFVCYEELKRWRMRVAASTQKGQALPDSYKETGASDEEVKLDNAEYIVMSGVSKLAAIALTYPYQVVRSRIQVNFVGHFQRYCSLLILCFVSSEPFHSPHLSQYTHLSSIDLAERRLSRILQGHGCQFDSHLARNLCHLCRVREL
jgi:solute carrier family 25 folate transporter 32